MERVPDNIPSTPPGLPVPPWPHALWKGHRPSPSRTLRRRLPHFTTIAMKCWVSGTHRGQDKDAAAANASAAQMSPWNSESKVFHQINAPRRAAACRALANSV